MKRAAFLLVFLGLTACLFTIAKTLRAFDQGLGTGFGDEAALSFQIFKFGLMLVFLGAAMALVHLRRSRQHVAPPVDEQAWFEALAQQALAQQKLAESEAPVHKSRGPRRRGRPTKTR